MTDEARSSLLDLTADIVAAHVSNNNVASAEVPGLISNVYNALQAITNPVKQEEPQQQPAVSVRSSIKPDYIVCLEDGKKLKMLRRYLRTNYQMTPEEYRAKWHLPADYPMVAPNYAEQRRGLAQTIGLGRRKPAEPETQAANDQEEAPAPPPRRSKAKAKAKDGAAG